MIPSVVDHIGLYSDNEEADIIVKGLPPTDPAFELKGEKDKPNSRSPDHYQGTPPFGAYQVYLSRLR